MKKKLMVLMTTAILAIGGITVYAQGTSNVDINKTTSTVSNKATDNFSKIEEIMRDNGFGDAAKAMENRDFDAMNKFMNNLTDEDYTKMIDIMKNNGYGPMAKMMGSVSRQGMVQIHQTMIGNGNRGMMGVQ